MRNPAYLLIIAANIIGGLTYIGQRHALEGLPPATISLGRNLLALLAMAVWLTRTGGIRWDYSRRDWGLLLLAGVLGYAAPLFLGTLGVELSTAGNASILILIEPASILIFSWLLLSESITHRQVIGVGAGGVGARLKIFGSRGGLQNAAPTSGPPSNMATSCGS